jgi:serine/threonine-protein kinase
MLVGDIPYTSATTLGDLMVAIIAADLPLIQDSAPWVPPELAEIVHRSMSRDPDKRFLNASDLRDALLAIVPDGPRLTRSQVLSVDKKHRTIVQPRLQVTDGMLKAVQRTGFSMAQTQASAAAKPKTSSAGIVVASIAGFLLFAGIAGTVSYRVLSSGSGEAAAAASALPLAASAPLAEPGPAAEVKRLMFQLVVLPPDAEVQVDGEPVTVEGESVFIKGLPGDTRTVRLSKAGKATERIVAITQNGLIPPKVELAQPKPEVTPEDTTPARPQAPHPRPRPRGLQGGTPKVAPAPTPQKAENPISNDTSEFQ